MQFSQVFLLQIVLFLTNRLFFFSCMIVNQGDRIAQLVLERVSGV